MADPTQADPAQAAAEQPPMTLAVVDQHVLEREVRKLLARHEPPEGWKRLLRTRREAREYLLRKWVGRLYDTLPAGTPHDDGVVILPMVGAVYLPTDAARAAFRGGAPIASYGFAEPGRTFKRIAMPTFNAAGAAGWHLQGFQVAGAGAGVRIGIADSGFAPGRSGVTLAGYAAFDPVTGAERSQPVQDFAPGLHGTQVASFACSQNEGVAPLAEAVVAAVLTEQGGLAGTPIQIAAGLDWLARQGLDVVNCSFGSPGYESTWYTAIQNLRLMDVVVVAGIGNEPGLPLFPARFHNVIAVGAVDVNGTPGSFSATGLAADGLGQDLDQPKPELYRPGVNLFGAVKGGTISGTSYASPMAAGQLALALRGHKNLPEDASLIVQALAGRGPSLNPGAPGTSANHDCEPGVDMSTNFGVAIEVPPDLSGFRIERPNGDVVGTHSGATTIHTWAMEAGNNAVWPPVKLTLTPVPLGQSLGWSPGQPPNIQNALGSMFENTATQGALPTMASLGADLRYLVKANSGQTVIAILYVKKDGTGLVHEYGHPNALIDDRLVLHGTGRYYPSNGILTLVPMADQASNPSWGGSYLRVVL